METRLVAKGRPEPLEGLVEQGRALVRLAQRFAAELDAHGFSQDDTAELDLGVARLESEEARAVERMRALPGHTEAIARAPTEPSPDVIDGELARDLVRRAAPKIAGYLGRMRGAAARIDERLSTGSKATSALDAAARAIERAGSPPPPFSYGASKLANAPAIFALKGRVLERMEALNQAAARAFAGREDVRSKFNLDILQAARTARGPRAHG